jgi:hypothetical protein
MKKLLVLSCFLAAAALIACGEEGDIHQPRTPRAPEFQDLSETWHVLNNIELAYTKRRIEKYEQLLDENFTFYLANGDVGNGVPASWDRGLEIMAHMHLFASDPPGDLPRCKDIDVDIMWEDNDGKPNVVWVEVVTPSDETWYMTTVFYDFTFDVEPDLIFIPRPGSKASFTVRNAGTEEAPQWRLVEMRDLGGSSSASAAAASTEQATFGKMKAMYR